MKFTTVYIWEDTTYVVTGVCCGDTLSPIITNFCITKIATLGKEEFPRGSEVIEKKRYVDDLPDSSSNLPGMLRKRDKTEALLEKFEIKFWQSNHPDVGKVKVDGNILGAR